MDGTTIFLTTHYIEEAEALCNRVGIMHHCSDALDTPYGVAGKAGVDCCRALMIKRPAQVFC
jgi:ABC-2 type transport system ATP-binding protein